MQNVQIEVIKLTQVAQKKWWLVFETNFEFLDVLFADVHGVDVYRSSWHDNNPGKRMMERSFATEQELAYYIMEESPLSEVNKNLALIKPKIDSIRLVNAIHRDHLVEMMMEEIGGNENQAELDTLTTQADKFYLKLEDGMVPAHNELLTFMDNLVNFLEKQGGKVKGMEYSK